MSYIIHIHRSTSFKDSVVVVDVGCYFTHEMYETGGLMFNHTACRLFIPILVRITDVMGKERRAMSMISGKSM